MSESAFDSEFVDEAAAALFLGVTLPYPGDPSGSRPRGRPRARVPPGPVRLLQSWGRSLPLVTRCRCIPDRHRPRPWREPRAADPLARGSRRALGRRQQTTGTLHLIVKRSTCRVRRKFLESMFLVAPSPSQRATSPFSRSARAAKNTLESAADLPRHLWDLGGDPRPGVEGGAAYSSRASVNIPARAPR